MHNAEHAIVGHMRCHKQCQIESNLPIVQRHTYLDRRQPVHALLTTAAFGAE